MKEAYKKNKKVMLQRWHGKATAPRSCSFPDSSKALCFIRTASITLRQCVIKYGKCIQNVPPHSCTELTWKTPSSYHEMPRCGCFCLEAGVYCCCYSLCFCHTCFVYRGFQGWGNTGSAALTSTKCKASLLAIDLSNGMESLLYI